MKDNPKKNTAAGMMLRNLVLKGQLVYNSITETRKPFPAVINSTFEIVMACHTYIFFTPALPCLFDEPIEPSTIYF